MAYSIRILPLGCLVRAVQSGWDAQHQTTQFNPRENQTVSVLLLTWAGRHAQDPHGPMALHAPVIIWKPYRMGREQGRCLLIHPATPTPNTRQLPTEKAEEAFPGVPRSRGRSRVQVKCSGKQKSNSEIARSNCKEKSTTKTILLNPKHTLLLPWLWRTAMATFLRSAIQHFIPSWGLPKSSPQLLFLFLLCTFKLHPYNKKRESKTKSQPWIILLLGCWGFLKLTVSLRGKKLTCQNTSGLLMWGRPCWVHLLAVSTFVCKLNLF